ncbi:MAG: MFS transporter [Chloroflexi bacterium]|nr:MFS transporter [Chloroflexota bacterium]
MSRTIELPAPAVCRELVTDDGDLRAIGRRDLARMAFLQYLVRDFEKKVLEFKDADLVHGPAHTSVGQEAVAAGVAAALRKRDMIGSTHRAHGHFLAKAVMYYAPDGYDPLVEAVTAPVQDAVNRTLAEIMGLRAGWCGGRGGSMHLYDGTSGNLGSNAIVGGSIALATGAAWGERLQGRDTIAVSFFGDGAINQGVFHEVANMAGLWSIPILYLVENNSYAVGTAASESSHVNPLGQRSLGYGFDSLTVDGMDPVAMYVAVRDLTARMRSEPQPFLLEARTYRHVHHAGSLAGSAFGYRTRDEEAEWLDRDPIDTFGPRLVALGIITEEEDGRLRRAARRAIDVAQEFSTEERDGKRVIPTAKWPDPAGVLTGVRSDGAELRGVRYAEREDFSTWREMTFVEAIAAVTRRNMERDERVLVLGEEVANLRGGAFAATRGIKEVFPERLLNTPISETGFLGMSGGAAMVGMRPVVEVMYPDFSLMASDQLFNQIGRLRHMYGDRGRFPLVMRTRIGKGFGYGGQHSMDPSGFFSLFPGWRVMAPSTPFDYIGMFNTAMRYDDPVLMVEYGLLYAQKGQVPADDLDYCIEYGKARVVRPGRDVTVLTYVTGVSLCLQAAEALAAEGIEAEVIDLRTVDYQGMDYAAIEASVRKTGAAVTVEYAERSLSLGARLADEITLRCFDYLDAPVTHVNQPDAPLVVSRMLEKAMLPSLEGVQQAIRRAARREV